MATNTFSSAAAQQASHQQGMKLGGGRPVSVSASAGRGHEFSSVHSSGSMWQHASASASGPVSASASASAHSHSSNNNHQQKSRQSRPTNRPANRTGRPSRNRISSRNANHVWGMKCLKQIVESSCFLTHIICWQTTADKLTISTKETHFYNISFY